MPEIIDQANELAESRLDVSAVLTVRKNLKNVASTRGDACRQ